MSDDKTSLKEVVSNYLRENPGFLEENPDVLESLQINHSSGTAVSLIERQVEQLRASNEDLNNRLNNLVRVAAENEQLISRLHRLTLELMPVDSRSEFFTQLGNSLLNDFNADILQICLADEQAAAEAGDDVIHFDIEQTGADSFAAVLEKGEVVCGRLNEAKLEYLFHSKARWVRSTALVPLGEQGALGMMAIGSSDENRFYPGMGTLFLDLLADVVAARLSMDLPEEQRRSA
jgi:uncharacterized protein YigA (DUF484 family)